MNCRRETVEKGVPARHREPARSGEAGGPPGNPARPRDWIRTVLEQYVAGGACPEPVEGTPEDARKDAVIRGRSKQFMKHPG